MYHRLLTHGFQYQYRTTCKQIRYSSFDFLIKLSKSDLQKRILTFSITHILLRVLAFPSIRIPASLSSGFANSDNGGKDLRFRNKILSLCGENDKAGSGGASTISLISGGGRRYPPFNADYTTFQKQKEIISPL